MNEAHLKFYMDRYKWRPLTNAAGELTGEWLSCPVRLAFCHLAEPRKNQRDELEFAVSGIVPVGADLSAIFKAAGDLGTATFGPGYGAGVKTDAYKFPFKRQAKLHEKKYQGFEHPEGFYFDCKSKYAPGIVGRNAEPLSPKSESEVYSGMWAILRLNLYTYGIGKGAKPGSTKGVGFGLRAIQKIADDEVFKGGSSTDVFGDVEALPGSVAGPAAAPNTANAFDFV